MLFVHESMIQKSGSFYIGEKLCAAANKILNKEILKNYWNGHTFTCSEIEFSDCDKLIFSLGEAKMPELCGNAYAINIEESGVCITADSEKNLIYGYMTFLDLIKMDNDGKVFAACCEIKESPAVKRRMTHFCVFPETELWELERFVKLCGALKYSHIIVEFWGSYKYECMKELSHEGAFTKEQLKPVISMANDLGTEIIPMFNHWGHASQCRQINGKHTTLAQNPKLQYLFSDDGWRWRIENPKVANLFKEIRRELIELCGNGEYFCIGCDEADGFTYTKEEMNDICAFLNNVTDELAQYGRRPILWGDMFLNMEESYNKENNYCTQAPTRENALYMREHLNKNAIIADWQYGAMQYPVETAVDLSKSGFDVAVCPWNYDMRNGTACIDTIKEHNLFGLIHTTWNTLSANMPMLSKDASLCWRNSSKVTNERAETIMTYRTKTAAILRKVFPSTGDYKKDGWATKQVGEMTN